MAVASKTAGRPEESSADLPGKASVRGRVWDPLVRLFHWLLVGAFAVAWFERSIPAVHETAGKVVLALVIFRAFWGLAGPYSARFESFVRGPAHTRRYLLSVLIGRPERYLGHNPAGAAMVGLLLLCLAGVSVSGVLMVTTVLWGNGWVEWAHGMFADACVVLIAAHVIGVLLASLQHREALPVAMITGIKMVEAGTPDCLGPPPDRVKPMILAVLVVILSVTLWLGSVKVLDASVWRMARLMAMQAAKAGCADATVSGPVVEVWPSLGLRYELSARGRTKQVAVALTEALEKSNPSGVANAMQSFCGPEQAAPGKATLISPEVPVAFGDATVLPVLVTRLSQQDSPLETAPVQTSVQPHSRNEAASLRQPNSQAVLSQVPDGGHDRRRRRGRGRGRGRD